MNNRHRPCQRSSDFKCKKSENKKKLKKNKTQQVDIMNEYHMNIVTNKLRIDI